MGRFNDDGSFVFKKEQDIGHHLINLFNYSLAYLITLVDPWLEGVEESELEKMIASASAGKKKIEERKLNEENNSSNTKNLSQMELKMELLKFMMPGESVTKAMNRYSSKNKVLYLLTHSPYLLTYLLAY